MKERRPRLVEGRSLGDILKTSVSDSGYQVTPKALSDGRNKLWLSKSNSFIPSALSDAGMALSTSRSLETYLAR